MIYCWKGTNKNISIFAVNNIFMKICLDELFADEIFGY